MKAILPRILLSLHLLAATAFALPSVLELADGRKLEGVAECVPEGDKLKVTHASGVSRIAPIGFAPSALIALGIPIVNSPNAAAAKITRVETLDGKVYKEVKSVRIKPSFISFVHKDGSAAVRFEQLPEAIRQQCGYDKAVADAFDKNQEAKQRNLDAAANAEEKAQAKAKAKAERQAQADQDAVTNAVRNAFQRKRDLQSMYGPDLGEYIYHQQPAWEREDGLQAAALARALSHH